MIKINKPNNKIRAVKDQHEWKDVRQTKNAYNLTITLGKPKKSSSLNGQAIKDLPPPSSLMAVGKLERFFSLMAQPFTPLPPLNGPAIKRRTFFSASLRLIVLKAFSLKVFIAFERFSDYTEFMHFIFFIKKACIINFSPFLFQSKITFAKTFYFMIL